MLRRLPPSIISRGNLAASARLTASITTFAFSATARTYSSVPRGGAARLNASFPTSFRSSSHSLFGSRVLARTFSSSSAEGEVIKVPSMGDSISEGTILTWKKKVGDSVKTDEMICNIETDKVTIDICAPDNGVITEIFAEEAATIKVGAPLYRFKKGAAPAKEAAPSKASSPLPPPKPSQQQQQQQQPSSPTPPSTPPPPPAPAATKVESKAPSSQPASGTAGPRERRVTMTRMRQRIAERLKDSQNTAAMLTTFNEIDMSGLMQLRTQFKDEFEKKHGVKFGFMSAFVKASVAALMDQPVVNAVIDGKDIVYRDYYDISVAVASPRGLVVPVLRNCDKLSFAAVEKELAALGEKAKKDTITLEDMAGGTFTISNGGVFGSMFGTPIINPPQSAILGMHAIKDRPVAINGQVVVRPIMYVALTYDHRLIDGREAVTFLKKIKDAIEDPRKLLLDL